MKEGDSGPRIPPHHPGTPWASASEFISTIRVPTPFPVGPVNVHLIRREPITLVDVGPLSDDAWTALALGLRAHGLGMKDVQRILLTHAHHDHFGLAARVADASGAQILGGAPDERPFGMRRNAKLLLDAMARAGFDTLSRFSVVASIAWVDRFAEPLPAWDALEGGEILPGDGYSVRIRSTPGHTPGSLTFEIPEAGVLFTGDTVLHGITPNAVVVEDPENPGEPFRSLSRYFETLDAIEQANKTATLLTGHGKSIADYAGHRRGVARRAALRQDRIEAELRAGPRTIRELVTRLFPRVTALNVFLAFSEVAGFLMYLEDLGRVRKLRERTRDRYRLTVSSS